MRRLSRKKALNLVKELDAFPKVPESYVETSASGGTGKLNVHIFGWMSYIYIASLMQTGVGVTYTKNCALSPLEIYAWDRTIKTSLESIVA